METHLVHPDWTESPLVRHAIRRAGRHAEAIDMLCVLSDMMNELEELVPGVPFADIVSAWEPQAPAAVRDIVSEALYERGLTVEQVVDLMGEDERSHYERHPHHDEILAAHAAGGTLNAIAEQYGVSKSYVQRTIDDARARAGTPRQPRPKDVRDDPEFDAVRVVVLSNPQLKDPERMVIRTREAGLKMGYRRLRKVMELVRS